MTPTENKSDQFFRTDSDYDVAPKYYSEDVAYVISLCLVSSINQCENSFHSIPCQQSCEDVDFLDRNIDNMEVLSLCGDNEEVVDIDQECMKNLYFKQRSNSFESTSRESDAVYDIQNLSSSSIRSLNSSKYDIKGLCAKSNSAPVLPRSEKKFEPNFNKKPMLRYSRSQSDKYLAGGFFFKFMFFFIWNFLLKWKLFFKFMLFWNKNYFFHRNRSNGSM